jgi:hypothetical protein
MRLYAVLLACLACAFASPATAKGDETAAWGQVGAWEVRVDRTTDNGCFAVASYDDGTTARVGINKKWDALYVLLRNRDWTSLEAGKLYPVKFVFDGIGTYDGELQGLKLGNTVYLVHHNLSPDFIKDFMQRNRMEVFYRGTSIARLSLKDTYAAFLEVLNCQKEFGFSASKSGGDPFSERPTPTRDPFK